MKITIEIDPFDPAQVSLMRKIIELREAAAITEPAPVPNPVPEPEPTQSNDPDPVSVPRSVPAMSDSGSDSGAPADSGGTPGSVDPVPEPSVAPGDSGPVQGSDPFGFGETTESDDAFPSPSTQPPPQTSSVTSVDPGDTGPDIRKVRAEELDALFGRLYNVPALTRVVRDTSEKLRDKFDNPDHNHWTLKQLEEAITTMEAIEKF